MPSLKLIPPCPNREERIGDPRTFQKKKDPRLYPLADIVQFCDAEAICILHDDEKNYVVGYLCVSREVTRGSVAEEVEAQLCLYYSYDSTWEVLALPIFYKGDDIRALLRWTTTTAVAFGTYFCWINYQYGVLFCDMSQELLKVTYLPLPVNHHIAPNVCMETYRSISIVQNDGVPKMKFVDVRPSHGYVNRPRPDSFEINCWTLFLEGCMEWKHECVLRDNELCIDKLVPTPHGPLMLPLVSMEDPQVVYFLVCELEYDARKAWIVPVDLISRSMMHLLPFDNDADKVRTSWQSFAPFLPSEITKFFQQIVRDSIAVMGAHDALPNCLQGDILVDKLETSVKTEGPVLSWAASNVELQPDLGRIFSEVSIKSADIQIEDFQQISFRLLCPVSLVGGLIGERGLIIRVIEYETGASIAVGACLGGCKECVITIAAIESPHQCSKVQAALVHIFGRMVELKRNAHSMFGKPPEFSVRALMQKRHIGCLIGLGGSTIEEMTNAILLQMVT